MLPLTTNVDNFVRKTETAATVHFLSYFMKHTTVVSHSSQEN